MRPAPTISPPFATYEDDETMIVDVDYLTRMLAPEPELRLPEPRSHGDGVLSSAYLQRIVEASALERRTRLGKRAP
jgi:hypothetical protein